MAQLYSKQELKLLNSKAKINPPENDSYKYDTYVRPHSVDNVVGKLYDAVTSGIVDVNTLVLQGTSAASTSQSTYGINLIDTSTLTDYATRLPHGIKGKEVIYINNSTLPINVYPYEPGGTINGIVNGVGLVPPNGRPYSFYCTINPHNQGWVYTAPATSTITLPEMSVAHTQTAHSVAFTDGVTYDSTAGVTWGGSFMVLVNGWEMTTLGSTYLARLKCYSNILYTDLASEYLPDGIHTAFDVGYQSGPSGVTNAQATTFTFFGDPSTTYPVGDETLVHVPSTAYAGNVGDTATLYGERAPSTSPIWSQIGPGGPFGSIYYYFVIDIPASAITKTYKFQWYLEVF